MSTRIKGAEGLTIAQIQDEVAAGGKFVIYQYCISIIILTFKRPSAIHFIKADESSVNKGLIFSLISLLLGWWGIPWGPIYTIGSFITNFDGGKDVTDAIMDSLSLAQPIGRSMDAAA